MSYQNEAFQFISGHYQPVDAEPVSVDTQSDALTNLPQVHSHLSINSLINTGVLINLPDSQLAFVHPMVLGYLAGKRIASSSDVMSVQNQPNWKSTIALLHVFLWRRLIPGNEPDSER
jgi:hypothetical protein